ncbi:MAG: hypothetical protein JRN39_05720 [Nitrososphaerota archaeon]|nr:hypothetical protein [Nitrososphaerota archaeon]
MLGIVLKDPFLDRSFPTRGTVMAVVDTGYDGFVAVPEDVFAKAGFAQLSPTRRLVVTADGHPLEMVSAMGSVGLPELGLSVGGPVESAPGMEEILVGTMLLRGFKVTLNYCVSAAGLEICR